MKLADSMQDLSGFDPRARGAGKESLETPAGTSALFAGVLSSVAQGTEPDIGVGAKPEPDAPTVDAVIGNVDPACAATTTFGPTDPRTTLKKCSVDAHDDSKGKAKPQPGTQLSDIVKITPASTTSAALKALKIASVERGSGGDKNARGLMSMLLSNSSLSNSPTARNATAASTQGASTFKERANAATEEPTSPDLIQDASSVIVTDPAPVSRSSGVRGQREAKDDGPGDPVAMLLSGLGTQSFSPWQMSVGGKLPNSSEPHLRGATVAFDTARFAYQPDNALAPPSVTKSMLGENESAPVATINAATLAVESVSTYLGSTSALAPAEAVSPLPPATLLPFEHQTEAEPAGFAQPIAGAVTRLATDQKPETPTHADGNGDLTSLHPERPTVGPPAPNDASASKRLAARSRIVATDVPRADESPSNDESVSYGKADTPIERSQQSEVTKRVDHDPQGGPTAKSVSEPIVSTMSDTSRQVQIASAVSRIAAAVTDMVQRAAAPSAPSMPSHASARTLTLRMDQADLGPISIRMHLAGRALDLQLTVRDHETVALLQRERETLTSALGDSAYRLHSLVIQGDVMSVTTSGHVGTDAGGQGTRADSHDPTPQEGSRNNAHAGSDRQRRQGDKPDPSRSLAGNSRGSLFV